MKKPNLASSLKETRLISLEVLKLIYSGLRARVLNRLVEAPQTVQTLAEEFGVPMTRLYYHVHLLEAHGLVEVVAEHPAGGTIEKVYRATARQFLLDREQLAAPGPAALAQAKVLTDVGLREAAKDIHRSVAQGQIDLRQHSPAPQSLFLRRGFGKLTKAQAAQFHRKLAALMTEFTTLAAPDDQAATGEDGYALVLAFYPSRQGEET